MSIGDDYEYGEDCDYSRLLTDIALLQHRNRPVKALVFTKRPVSGKKSAPSHTAALVAFLSRALDQKLARKISGNQFLNLRYRVNETLRRLP
jgi:hypothetical protein